MKKDDYRSEFEEDRQEISLDEGISHPSRSELHRKGRKPKKKSGNGTINTILALFTLIPVGILVYVLSDFYTPNNSSSANVVNANTSYEMNKNISAHNTSAGNKDVVVEEDDEEEIASVPVEKPENIETKEEEKTEDQPVEKPIVETETESKTDDSAIAKTHTVLPGETLYRISTNYYQSDIGIEKIKNANGLSSNNIMVGQKLIIP